MSTKNGTYNAFSPYESSYDAFINYMNVVSDLQIRLDQQFPKEIETEELNPLLKQIDNQGKEIEALTAKLEKAEAALAKAKGEKKPAKSAAKPSAKASAKTAAKGTKK
jgi:alpha-amylase